ncbi:hypothetical protein PVK06_040364 [Gossypium arboreum]|uniref:DUF4283 domain-containing protein n=1 Tax=Gossypium arboreum TaxID=29729 RepID=A0ABR0N596_GOSAR|nr:hypothetical protein PVK06_040364 [Gossypium arboreum]
MANLWHPLRGVEISELRAKWFLFKFFHRVDVDRVISVASWTFNGHLLVFHWLREEDGLLTVPLMSSDIETLSVHYVLTKGEGLELHYDFSFHVQPRRVATTNNIWLRDRGSKLVLGNTL